MAIVSQLVKPLAPLNLNENRSVGISCDDRKSEDLSFSDDENSRGFLENRAVTLQNKKTLVDR